MRRPLVSILIGVMLGSAFARSDAAVSSLTNWFFNASSVNAPGSLKTTGAPDFLPGKALKDRMCGPFSSDADVPIPNTFWSLRRYDRTHHIALAYATTDQQGCAVFVASTPPAAVPNADLSRYCTGRGLCVGSPYSKVLALYGPPARKGRHFVTSYEANIPTMFGDRPIKLGEKIVIVIDNGRISSLAVDHDTAS